MSGNSKTASTSGEQSNAKVVSLLENIALGMDHLLKSELSGKGQGERSTHQAKATKTHPSKNTPDSTAFAALGMPASWALITSKQIAKSGESRTAADNVVYQIKWPQEYIYAVDGSRLKFNDLSIVQFTRGFIAMINDSPNELQPSMLTHLSETMVDAEKFTWESVLKFQASIFQGIEAGKITFKDLNVINLWRLRHSFNPIVPHTMQEASDFEDWDLTVQSEPDSPT